MPDSRARAFSLVELSSSVAIMMVLAAIAVPSVAQLQRRARRAEAAPNAYAIADAAYGYATNDPRVVIDTDYDPRSTQLLDRNLVDWDAAASGWAELGWAPDGALRCSYLAGALAQQGIGNVACDVDDDNVLYLLFVYRSEAAMAIPVEQFCHGDPELTDCY